VLAYPPRSLGEPGNKRVVGRWQLAIVGVLDGQPISNNIDGRFDGQESLAHKKAHIIMGLSDLCGGGAGRQQVVSVDVMKCVKAPINKGYNDFVSVS